MIYSPKKGKIKDNCMVYENGTYYLYSMYCKENSDRFCNIWLARSADGVHFEDYGCVVEDFPDLIWAMKVYRGKDAFYMNSGSFTADGRQGVLKFWKSADLLHWEYQPDLDVTAPDAEREGTRLDCMNVVEQNGKYYGYATGQNSFLTSDDGAHFITNPAQINCDPFPPYNTAYGGFEVADCILFDGTFYLFCGGFGHLGMQGYGVYLYKSETPCGPFTANLPYYRINGTSCRWVNMWERCFQKDGEYLAHNYMYNGHHYEQGDVFLPPIKRLAKSGERLYLKWWEGNDALIGDKLAEVDHLDAAAQALSATVTYETKYAFSDLIKIPSRAVIDLKLTLSQNGFTEYSSGGIFLSENGRKGTAIIFDTYGSAKIIYIDGENPVICEDVISFGSAAPYYLEAGKTYSVRILTKDGMFEIYIDGEYLQTFNNAHFPDTLSVPFTAVGAVAERNGCILSQVEIKEMR